MIFSAAQLLIINAETPAIIAVIGCGGKTTFIKSIAREYQQRKVLITPTTKILPIISNDVILCQTLQECDAHRPICGIQCMGVRDAITGKLSSLPFDILQRIAAQYDLVLLEADGSRGLPCKGWLPSEPAIPPYCSHTIGIVTLNALGKAANEQTVLHVPEFLALTGLKYGSAITLDALTRMVLTGGMLQKAVGSCCLFVNQVEDPIAETLAKEFLGLLLQQAPKKFAVLAYGSAKNNLWHLFAEE